MLYGYLSFTIRFRNTDLYILSLTNLPGQALHLGLIIEKPAEQNPMQTL